MNVSLFGTHLHLQASWLVKLISYNSILFRYVIVYFSILYLRYHAGIVTDEMLSMPKAPYIVAGLLEALGAATGMAAAGNAPFITRSLTSAMFPFYERK